MTKYVWRHHFSWDTSSLWKATTITNTLYFHLAILFIPCTTYLLYKYFAMAKLQVQSEILPCWMQQSIDPQKRWCVFVCTLYTVPLKHLIQLYLYWQVKLPKIQRKSTQKMIKLFSMSINYISVIKLNFLKLVFRKSF